MAWRRSVGDRRRRRRGWSCELLAVGMKEQARVGGWQLMCCCRRSRASQGDDNDTSAHVEVEDEIVVDETLSGCAGAMDSGEVVEAEDIEVVARNDHSSDEEQLQVSEKATDSNSDNEAPLEPSEDEEETVAVQTGRTSMMNRGLGRWQRVMAIRQSDPLRHLIAYDLEHGAVLPLMRAHVTQIQRRLVELKPRRLVQKRSNADRHSV